LHWVIVGVVSLLVISPSQLPVVARRTGQLMRDAQRFRQHLHAELRDVVSDFDLHGEAPSDRRAE
jgi:Sec-independent protein translocase protein TatA